MCASQIRASPQWARMPKPCTTRRARRRARPTPCRSRRRARGPNAPSLPRRLVPRACAACCEPDRGTCALTVRTSSERSNTRRCTQLKPAPGFRQTLNNRARCQAHARDPSSMRQQQAQILKIRASSSIQVPVPIPLEQEVLRHGRFADAHSTVVQVLRSVSALGSSCHRCVVEPLKPVAAIAILSPPYLCARPCSRRSSPSPRSCATPCRGLGKTKKLDEATRSYDEAARCVSPYVCRFDAHPEALGHSLITSARRRRHAHACAHVCACPHPCACTCKSSQDMCAQAGLRTS